MKRGRTLPGRTGGLHIIALFPAHDLAQIEGREAVGSGCREAAPREENRGGDEAREPGREHPEDREDGIGQSGSAQSTLWPTLAKWFVGGRWRGVLGRGSTQVRARFGQ